ncbi:MAG: hypothetical protein ABL931_07920 [Usitatibacteraceae bacterium]
MGSLDLVPWERLGPGDTVRIFFRPEPYRGKIFIAAQGTANAIVRVCGVKGPMGERPVIAGRDASTRRGLNYGHPLHESRSIVLINRQGSEDWKAFPTNVKIDGLAISGANPSNQFTDAAGHRHNYSEFGACIWVERGHFVSIVDNEISDCTQAIFTKSTDEGDFALTREIRIVGNNFHNNGLAGSNKLHSTYVQSVGVIYEFNRYGPLREGAKGNSIKDRSVGTVVRYNRIEDGARALDLVEAEDFPRAARANPAYRATYVYGNQIIKDGRKGSAIHYGGDHNGSSPGADWGEPNNRKGTLFFFHNTVRLTGDGYGVLFQLSTTEESAEVWNNIFVFDPTIPTPRMRAGTEVGASWKAGGILKLGRNWISENWRDTLYASKLPQWLQGTENLLRGLLSEKWRNSVKDKLAAPLQGIENLTSGSRPPIDLATLAPLPRSSADLVPGPSSPSGAETHPVLYELDTNFRPSLRKRTNRLIGLGALEVKVD